eukprot:TRINITY_DN8295_c0_g4_i1.p1 TRINITY_DN8295_c0_g4~~TRINITY_DN8295_c0_g4_i1.p1  ORF type:complete len:1107 (-),score=228.35 TRINITY_DN8295_c0_g4_i1:106-3426(-)
MEDLPPARLPKLREVVSSDRESSPSSNRLHIGIERLTTQRAVSSHTERRQRLDKLKQNRRKRNLQEDEFRGDWADRECRQKWDRLRHERRERSQNLRLPELSSSRPPPSPKSKIAVGRVEDVLSRSGELSSSELALSLTLPLTPRLQPLGGGERRDSPSAARQQLPAAFDEDDPDLPMVDQEKPLVPVPPPGPPPDRTRIRPQGAVQTLRAAGQEHADKQKPPTPDADVAETLKPLPSSLNVDDASQVQASECVGTDDSCVDVAPEFVMSPVNQAVAAEVVDGLLRHALNHNESQRTLVECKSKESLRSLGELPPREDAGDTKPGALDHAQQVQERSASDEQVYINAKDDDKHSAVDDKAEKTHLSDEPKPTPSSYDFEIVLVSARGLRDSDWFWGSSDPYCLCEVVGKSQVSLQTQTCSGTEDPVWNHKAQVTLAHGDSLKFTVCDEDMWKSDDLLGVAELKFDEFNSGFDGEVKLKHGGYLKVVMTNTSRDPVRPATNPEVIVPREVNASSAPTTGDVEPRSAPQHEKHMREEDTEMSTAPPTNVVAEDLTVVDGEDGCARPTQHQETHGPEKETAASEALTDQLEATKAANAPLMLDRRVEDCSPAEHVVEHRAEGPVVGTSVSASYAEDPAVTLREILTGCYRAISSKALIQLSRQCQNSERQQESAEDTRLGGLRHEDMFQPQEGPLATKDEVQSAGPIAHELVASKAESVLENSEGVAEEHVSKAGDQLTSAEEVPPAEDRIQIEHASQGDSQPTPAEEVPAALAAIDNMQTPQAETQPGSAEESPSTEAMDRSKGENQPTSMEKLQSTDTGVRSMSESRVAMPSAKPVADLSTLSPQSQGAGDSPKGSVLEFNRPVKADDLKNLCKQELRWHQWSTMGDRLEGKTPWSKLSQDRPTKEDPKTASIPLSVDWFRKHWSDVRKSSCPDEVSRPTSAQGRNQRLGDLVSPQAFHAKMSELHKEQCGEELQLISSGEVRPPLMQVLDISLPPPPNFAPPIRPEDGGLGAQQQTIAAALSAHATTVDRGLGSEQQTIAAALSAHATTVDRGLGAEQQTVAAAPSAADAERTQDQTVAAALDAHVDTVGAQQKTAAALNTHAAGL